MSAQGILNCVCLVSYQTGEPYLLPLWKLRLSVSVQVKDLSFLIYTSVNGSWEKQASHFRNYFYVGSLGLASFSSHINLECCYVCEESSELNCFLLAVFDLYQSSDENKPILFGFYRLLLEVEWWGKCKWKYSEPHAGQVLLCQSFSLILAGNKRQS